MKIDKKLFERQGFLLVKEVLSEAEVAALRKAAYETIENDEETGEYFLHRNAKNHYGCLSNIPEFRELILSEKVLSIAEQVLGEKPYFFGDSIFEIGIGNRGFHKDTSNRVDPNHPDWKEPYPIIRIAFYLENHKDYSGGLKVRLGSNRTVKTNVGKPIIIPSQAGDAVVFSLRTSHAGNAVRLKSFPNLSLHNSLEKRIPNFLVIPEEKERVSIFLTFGLPSGALDRYMRYMFNHKVYKKRITSTQYPPELVKEIEKKVKFINIKEEFAIFEDKKK